MTAETDTMGTGTPSASPTGTGTPSASPTIRRGPDGRACCAPAGACPPDATSLRCRFPDGDAPQPLRAPDGSVTCAPPPSPSPLPFTVEACFAEGGAPRCLAQGVLQPPVEGMRAFAAISLCYLLFTTTDGAIRMVTLFHAFQQGFTAWEVALMFSLYELAGVATNLLAGVAGARWGIRATLLCGLCTQLCSILLLFGFDIEWGGGGAGARWGALGYVTAAVGLGGVAKDLVKLGGKTVSKLVTPEEKQSRLFAVVAWLTGMKNSMKGVGYFVGAASLAVSLPFALGLNLALILLALPIAALGLRADVGRARSRNLSLGAILRPAPNVRALSAARAFLFGSRDLWFEVVLPFYLRDSAQGLGWRRELAGTLLAVFIIAYGQLQSATPRLVLRPLAQEPANKLVQVLWNSLLTAVCAACALAFTTGRTFPGRDVGGMTAALCALLAAFCAVFAVNSAIHSYLIVRYSAGDKVAADVGFYYMSNAVGRFVGTLVSGALYQFAAGGDKTRAMGWCFVASTLFSAASTALTLRIDDQQAGLACGRCVCVRPRAAAPPAPPKAAAAAASEGAPAAGEASSAS